MQGVGNVIPLLDLYIPRNWASSPQFASKVLCNNPTLPGRLLDDALPVLNYDRPDHNTKTNGALMYRPFSHCIDQAGLGAFTAKSGRKHYNPPPLTVMWMNFDSPNFPSFSSLSAIISFQTCSNKCILYVLSFHKCIKIKYKMVNMYGVFGD